MDKASSNFIMIRLVTYSEIGRNLLWPHNHHQGHPKISLKHFKNTLCNIYNRVGTTGTITPCPSLHDTIIPFRINFTSHSVQFLITDAATNKERIPTLHRIASNKISNNDKSSVLLDYTFGGTVLENHAGAFWCTIPTCDLEHLTV
jgi:hypothetical protein